LHVFQGKKGLASLGGHSGKKGPSMRGEKLGRPPRVERGVRELKNERKDVREGRGLGLREDQTASIGLKKVD